MNTQEDKLFLINEEIAYFKESSEYYPERILRDFTIVELEEFMIENSQELKDIGTEIQEALSYIPLKKYDEAEQMLLGASYNPYLMWLFLKKDTLIEKLIKIRESKLREQAYRDKKKEFLSEDQKKELINSKNILDVIGEYAGLPARYTKTRNIKCPLPSHEDKTASFHIYPHTNSFYCYGCRRGGGIVQFVKHIRGISDKEAFKELFPQN